MKDGGPAFPCEVYDFQPHSGEQVVRESYGGMTIRDYFAAKAMTVLIESFAGGDSVYARGAAEHCYRFADAMIAERDKPCPTKS